MTAARRRRTTPALLRWRDEGRLVPFCPEVAGGLGVPRAPADRRGGRVVDRHGRDVTAEFEAGAAAALAAAQAAGARIAILKERSPSCGVEAMGITAALLVRNGISAFSEEQIDSAAALLDALEPPPAGAVDCMTKKC